MLVKSFTHGSEANNYALFSPVKNMVAIVSITMISSISLDLSQWVDFGKVYEHDYQCF